MSKGNDMSFEHLEKMADMLARSVHQLLPPMLPCNTCGELLESTRLSAGFLDAWAALYLCGECGSVACITITDTPSTVVDIQIEDVSNEALQFFIDMCEKYDEMQDTRRMLVAEMMQRKMNS